MHNSTNRNAKMDIDIDRKTTSFKQTDRHHYLSKQREMQTKKVNQ